MRVGAASCIGVVDRQPGYGSGCQEPKARWCGQAGSGVAVVRARRRQTKFFICGAGKNAVRKGKGWFPNPPRFIG
jgi:hypothetical protein